MCIKNETVDQVQGTQTTNLATSKEFIRLQFLCKVYEHLRAIDQLMTDEAEPGNDLLDDFHRMYDSVKGEIAEKSWSVIPTDITYEYDLTKRPTLFTETDDDF